MFEKFVSPSFRAEYEALDAPSGGTFRADSTRGASPSYSDLSAAIGSSPAARRAGIQHAATEITRNSTVIAA